LSKNVKLRQKDRDQIETKKKLEDRIDIFGNKNQKSN